MKARNRNDLDTAPGQRMTTRMVHQPNGPALYSMTRTVTTRAAAAVGAALTITSLGVGSNLANSDVVIERGFERAFAALAPSATAVQPRPYDGISGSEDFWLRTGVNADGIVKAVSIGGEITLTEHGSERHMTIMAVREAGDAETHIDTAAASEPVLLLTCREGDTKTGREIRLRLESGRIHEVAGGPNSL